MADTAAERTRQAITAINNGDVESGRQILAEALQIDPEYELAWLWFAAVADNDEEKKFCLQRAQEVNPEHEANVALAPLKNVKAEAPPELTALVDPEPPEFVQDYVPALVKARRRRIWRFVGVVAGVLALLGLGAYLLNKEAVTPVYLAVVVADEQGNPSSTEIIDTVNLAVWEWNRSGKAGNNPLSIKYFYDKGDPAIAKQVAQEIVADDTILGVIGHNTSTTSLAASPIYAEAGMPAVTATATADAVTEDNDWYFRTVFDNSGQGEGIAAYVKTVLEKDTSVVISSDDAYGTTLGDAYVESFEKGGGTVQARIELPADGVGSSWSRDRVLEAVKGIDNPGPFILLVNSATIARIVPDLEGIGVDPLFVGGDALATPAFFEPLASRSKAKTVNSSLAASPLTRGALTGEAVQFSNDFAEIYGYAPTWRGPLAYDAVNIYAEAIRSADLGFDSIAEDRQRIRDRFDAARSVETALDALTGSLYFNDSDSVDRPVGMEDGRLAPNGTLSVQSAPVQLAPYSPSVGLSAKDEIANGDAVRFLGTVYSLQRIVQVGVNYNQVSEVSLTSQSYKADFFIWLKYGAGTKGAEDVVFPNGDGITLGEPERVQTAAGQTYALYRVSGTFKSQFNFRDFPFDTQVLPVFMQNRTLPAGRMTYTPDPDLLQQSQATRLESGVDAGSTVDQIPNWEASKILFYPMSVGNTSALGDPYTVAGTQGVTFSQFASTVDINRDVRSFLVKNLLPLILLSIVVYISLWLPFKDHTTRVSMAVTGILTGAVMLNTVTNSLPSISYTVAIEWAYYAFILLAASTVLITLLGRAWTEDRKLAAVRNLNRFARIYYPVVVLGVAFAYWLRFH